MFKIFIILITTSCLVCGVRNEDEDTCTTPSGGNGHCKNIYKCKQILDLLNNPNRTRKDIKLVRKSQCGFENLEPKVCCSDCFAPDGNQGICVELSQCPHVEEKLKLPLKEGNLNFVQRSLCKDKENTVCCGPPPDRPRNVTQLGEQVANENCEITVTPPLPKTGCCGMDSSPQNSGSRFETGVANIDQYPWIALIEYSEGYKTSIACQGVLISSKYVLTVSHCVSGHKLNNGILTSVRLGDYDINNPGRDCVSLAEDFEDCSDEPLHIPIEKVILHPEYESTSRLHRNDIALLKLKTDAPYTDFIRPICLPTVDITINTPPDLKLYIAGWDHKNTNRQGNFKKYGTLPYVKFQDCQNLTSSLARTPIWEKQICAKGKMYKETCSGDSGNPLTVQQGDHSEIIGLFSFGPRECGSNAVPEIFTNIYEYNSWIRSNMKP